MDMNWLMRAKKRALGVGSSKRWINFVDDEVFEALGRLLGDVGVQADVADLRRIVLDLSGEIAGRPLCRIHARNDVDFDMAQCAVSVFFPAMSRILIREGMGGGFTNVRRGTEGPRNPRKERTS